MIAIIPVITNALAIVAITMDFASDFLPWRSPRNIISILMVILLTCVCLCNAVFIVRLKYRKTDWKAIANDSHHEVNTIIL